MNKGFKGNSDNEIQANFKENCYFATTYCDKFVLDGLYSIFYTFNCLKL